jgi:hypothetical protein
LSGNAIYRDLASASLATRPPAPEILFYPDLTGNRSED